MENDGHAGNAECIKFLEMMLAEAKKGAFVQAALATVERLPSGEVQQMGRWVSPQRMHEHLIRSIDMLGDGLKSYVKNSTIAARDPSVSADHVVWNVPEGPHSYDFICWLVDAEMTRIREGAPAPLKVYFWFGNDGTSKETPFFSNVIRPALSLIGAVEEFTDVGGRDSSRYVLRDVSKGVRAGEKAPILRAPKASHDAVSNFLDGKIPVTITLREKGVWINRDSQVGEWLKFADHLKRQGRDVLFVRDTTRADEPLWHRTMGYRTYPDASKDLHTRMALYEQAACNLFVGNGPASLSWFTDRPWLMLVPIVEDDDAYWANTPSFWREMQGVENLGQYPWSRPDQRIIWGMDTFETIRDAWDELHLDMRPDLTSYNAANQRFANVEHASDLGLR